MHRANRIGGGLPSGRGDRRSRCFRVMLCAVLLGCASVACKDQSNAGRPGAGGQGGHDLASAGSAGAAGRADTMSSASGGASGAASGAANGGAMTAPGGTAGAGGREAGGALGTIVTDAPTGGVDWDQWPAVDPTPAGTCAVSQFLGGDLSSPPKRVTKELWEYDAAARILTRHHQAVGADPAWLGYARLDAQGRREMICHAYPGFDCVEWTRDAYGNAKGYSYYGVADGPLDARTLDPAHPPTKAPPTGGAETENDRLLYDSAGLITSATYYFPQQGATVAFSRDGEGRCSDVVWTIAGASLTEVDHWTYEAGKLVSRVVTNMNNPADVRAVMTYAYDADGALATTVVDGRLDFPDASSAPAPRRDGIADYVVRTVKLSDGGRWVEMLDFELADSRNNAHVQRGGDLTAAFRMRWYFSPACEALAMPRHTSHDCEFERPLASMPLSWHNPLVTPIQLWTQTPMPD
jgi:hypothetical protein